MASARRRRRDFGIQLSGRRMVLERVPRRGCGNATVWKPSPKTALCAIAVQSICNRVLERHALPRDLPIVHRCRHAISRSNSSTTGASRWSRSPARRRSAARSACASPSGSARVSLELGGNNAIIVDETANLDLAVPAIVFGAVGTAGQRCTTTRRVLVHRLARRGTRASARSPPTARCASAIRLDPRHLMGPLIDAGAVERYQAAIAAAEAQGGTCSAAAACSTRPGHFVEPAIVRASADMPIVQHETFAPILYLVSYEISTKPSRCRTRCLTACPRRSSPTGCRSRNASCRPRAAIAASPT